MVEKKKARASDLKTVYVKIRTPFTVLDSFEVGVIRDRSIINTIYEVADKLEGENPADAYGLRNILEGEYQIRVGGEPVDPTMSVDKLMKREIIDKKEHLTLDAEVIKVEKGLSYHVR